MVRDPPDDEKKLKKLIAGIHKKRADLKKMQHDIDDLLQDLERIEENFFESLAELGVIVNYEIYFIYFWKIFFLLKEIDCAILIDRWSLTLREMCKSFEKIERAQKAAKVFSQYIVLNKQKIFFN